MRHLHSVVRNGAALALLVPPSALLAAQNRTAPATLRTAWGAPYLQGTWDFHTVTPLERPEELAKGFPDRRVSKSGNMRPQRRSNAVGL